MPSDASPAELPPLASPLARALGHPLLWAGTAAVVLILALLQAFLLPVPPPLPVLGQLPTYQLTSQEGRPFGSAALQGRVYIADFVFTRCPTLCPRMTERLSTVEGRLRQLGDRLHIVSISVDPDYDSPAHLDAYARAHHADPRRWTFLTGPATTLQDTVVRAFHVAFTHEGAPDDFLSIVHGGQFVLVDGKGRIRGYYDSADAQALDALVRDAALLVNRG